FQIISRICQRRTARMSVEIPPLVDKKDHWRCEALATGLVGNQLYCLPVGQRWRKVHGGKFAISPKAFPFPDLAQSVKDRTCKPTVSNHLLAGHGHRKMPIGPQAFRDPAYEARFSSPAARANDDMAGQERHPAFL